MSDPSGSRIRLTGRQLTVIVVAVCAAIVLAPVGVFAASKQLVTINDGKHPARKATVSKDGALKVSGKVDADVSGQVRAVPGLPGQPFTMSGGSSYTVPAGKHFVVETISADLDRTGGSVIEGYLHYKSGGQTAEVYLPGTYTYYESSTTYYNFALVTGVKLYLDPGSSVYITAYGGSGNSVGTLFLTLSGYLV